ncbi:MAG: hypothetical protein WCG98_02410 [bacterium]
MQAVETIQSTGSADYIVLQDLLNFLRGTTETHTLDSHNKDQKTGFTEEMPKWRINTIESFVNQYDADVDQYVLKGDADGQPFVANGEMHNNTKKQYNEELNPQLKSKLARLGISYAELVPPTLQDCADTLTPNTLLALNRALIILVHLDDAVFMKMATKGIDWQINGDHTEIGGDWRA